MSRRGQPSGRIRIPHALFLGFLALLAVFVPLLAPLAGLERSVLVGFDLSALAFIAALVVSLGRAPAEVLRRRAARDDAGRMLALVVALVVSLVVLVVVGLELGRPGAGAATGVALIIVTLLLAWLFANLVFAIHYAHMFYDPAGPGADRAGLDFPGTPEPDFGDFCYFALVLGATFQVSDVQIASARIRRVAMLHGLSAFLFNIGIVALTVNVIASAI